MKKILLGAVLILVAATFTGCGKGNDASATVAPKVNKDTAEKIKILENTTTNK